jgi:hypothetical protein
MASHNHWIVHPIVLVLKEYALILGTQEADQSPTNDTQSIEDNKVSNTSLQKPSALFQSQSGNFGTILEGEDEMV